MKLRFLFLFFFISSLFANDFENDIRSIFNDSANVNNCVNAIFGTLNIVRQDLVVNAVEPISIFRSYASSDTLCYDGGWNFFPHLSPSLPS